MSLIEPTRVAIKISLKNLLASKLRSFLTILGVIIGVAAVIIIFAVGRSAQELILAEIKGVGSNLIGILPGASNEDGPPAAVMGITITTLTYDDLEAIRDPKAIPQIEAGAGFVIGSANFSQNGNEISASFNGTTASYPEVQDAKIKSGRFFGQDEEKNLSRVVVLGAKLAEDLFDGADPLGHKIEIKDQKFEVIGVLKEKGSGGFGSDQDNNAFVPLRTAQKLLLGINHLGFIRLKARRAEDIALAKKEITAILRDRHDIEAGDEDDFTVRDQASILETVTQITDVLRYFLLAVGSISLLVGGIGIMNIMLIAVNQRIAEIGLRKALGAKKEDITIQFLVESLTVALLGGIIGIIGGIIVSLLAAVVIRALGYSWPFLISGFSILAAVAVSMGTGIVFGLYPARKAARISPMEALRYE